METQSAPGSRGVASSLPDPATAKPEPRGPSRPHSRIQIGDQFTFESGNLIFQHQLALLQPAQLHFVDVQVQLQAMDHVIEVTMLDAQFPQPFQAPESFGFDFVLRVTHRGGTLNGYLALRIVYIIGAVGWRARVAIAPPVLDPQDLGTGTDGGWDFSYWRRRARRGLGLGRWGLLTAQFTWRVAYGLHLPASQHQKALAPLDAIGRVVEYVRTPQNHMPGVGAGQTEARDRNGTVEQLQPEALTGFVRGSIGTFSSRKAVMPEPAHRGGNQNKEERTPGGVHRR
jgi:hypothetical protein